jgi:hypothetical protein
VRIHRYFTAYIRTRAPAVLGSQSMENACYSNCLGLESGAARSIIRAVTSVVILTTPLISILLECLRSQINRSIAASNKQYVIIIVKVRAHIVHAPTTAEQAR